MRLIWILAAAFAVWAIGTRAQAEDFSAEAQAVLAVLAVEDAYIAAELARDDMALRRILHDAFVLNRSDGTTNDKEALITSVLSLNMIGQTITERTVLVQGDVAIVCATTELTFASATSEPRVSRLRYTSTYQNRDGAWRMLALHMSART